MAEVVRLSAYRRPVLRLEADNPAPKPEPADAWLAALAWPALWWLAMLASVRGERR